MIAVAAVTMTATVDVTAMIVTASELLRVQAPDAAGHPDERNVAANETAARVTTVIGILRGLALDVAGRRDATIVAATVTEIETADVTTGTVVAVAIEIAIVTAAGIETATEIEEATEVAIGDPDRVLVVVNSKTSGTMKSMEQNFITSTSGVARDSTTTDMPPVVLAIGTFHEIQMHQSNLMKSKVGFIAGVRPRISGNLNGNFKTRIIFHDKLNTWSF